MTRGKSIKLYIMGEDKKHLKSAELSNWTGKAFIGLRKHVSVLQKIEELSVPGVYFLLSNAEESNLKEIYIGEADEINKRLNDHLKNKEWWDEFVLFTSKDANLTKAHVRYLERKFYDVAIQNKTTVTVKNGNTPPSSKLPQSDRDDMEEFNDNVIFIMKNLGIIDFTKTGLELKTKKAEPENIVNKTNDKVFKINVPAPKGIKAKTASLIIEDDSYIVLADSYIRKQEVDSFSSHNYAKLRNQLAKDGLFKEIGDENFYQLTENVAFSSPSAAGAVVRNSSVNGKKMWKTDEGITIDDYENM